jgi:hypothetical protein
VCKHGDTIPLQLTVPAHLSHTGKSFVKTCNVDRCVAPIIKALNDGGVLTDGHCCGHEKMWGSISLVDGRWLIVAPVGTFKPHPSPPPLRTKEE